MLCLVKDDINLGRYSTSLNCNGHVFVRHQMQFEHALQILYSFSCQGIFKNSSDTIVYAPNYMERKIIPMIYGLTSISPVNTTSRSYYLIEEFKLEKFHSSSCFILAGNNH